MKNNKTSAITPLDWTNFHAVATGDHTASTLRGVAEHLDYKTLFAEIDSVGSVDHDSSILSPAVYFVDLMRLVEQKITDVPSGLSLSNRRPDLWEIELDAKNTSTELPYLEIVNNVLRQHLADKNSDNKPDNPVPTKKELERTQRARTSSARQRLTKNYFHFKPPVHIPLLQIRTYLAHFGIKLSDIYEAFGLADDNVAAISERLNLLPNDLQGLTHASVDLSDISHTYGVSLDSLFKNKEALLDTFSQLDYSQEQLRFLVGFKSPGDDLAEKVFNESAGSQDTEQALNGHFIKVSSQGKVSVKKDKHSEWKTIDQSDLGSRVLQVEVIDGRFCAVCKIDYDSSVALLYSADFGSTWKPAEPASTLIGAGMTCLVTVNDRIFAGALESTFSSEDGKTWQKIEDFAMRQAVEFGNQILVRDKHGIIYVSDNKGQAWETLDIKIQVLKNLINFDYLSRFIRLSYCLDCSFDDLFQQLQAIDATLIKTEAENRKDLQTLAKLQQCQQKLDVSVSVICSLFSDLSTQPRLNPPEGVSAFDSVFNNLSFYHPEGDQVDPNQKYLLSPEQALAWDLESTSLQSQGIRSSLIAALNINNNELQAIIEHIIEFDLFDNALFSKGGELLLYVETLSRFYRFSKMAKLLRMSIPEYLTLLTAITDSDQKCLDSQEVLSLDDLSIVIYWADLLKETEVNAWQLLLLKGGDSITDSRKFFDPGWNEASLNALIPSLYTVLIPSLIKPESFTHCTSSSKQAVQLVAALKKANLLVDVDPVAVIPGVSDFSKLGKLVVCPFVNDNQLAGEPQRITTDQIVKALPDSLVLLKNNERAVKAIAAILNDGLDFQVHAIILKLAEFFTQDESMVTNAVNHLNSINEERSVFMFLSGGQLDATARLLYLAKTFDMTADEHAAVLLNGDLFKSVCCSLDSIHAVSKFFYFVKQFKQQGTKQSNVAIELLALLQQGLESEPLALFSGWRETEIDVLKQHIQDMHGIDAPLDALVVMNRCFGLTKKMGIDTHMLMHLCDLHHKAQNFDEYSVVAHDFLAVLKSKYSQPDEWEKVFGPITNHLNECERDALVRLLRQQMKQDENKGIITYFDKIDSLQDLSNYLLIDVEMSGVAKISVVKQGMNTLQRYIQRCHTGLEAGGKVTCPVSDEEWKWRSHYRLWEANRKVFLYPENYLDPGLRKIKTPIYTELENALLQGDISEETVTQAYIHYFDKLDELARLTIVDSCEAKVIHPGAKQGEDTLFYIAKTESAPAVYYSRSAVVEENMANGLEAWTQNTDELASSDVYDLKRYPDGSSLFAATGGHVFRSDDGEEWLPENDDTLTTAVFHIASSPDGSLFVCGEQLCVKEPGKQWKDIWDAYQSIKVLLIIPDGSLLVGTEKAGIKFFGKNEDGWSFLSNITNFNSESGVEALALGADGRTLFASTYATAATNNRYFSHPATPGGIIRSLDNGKTWDVDKPQLSELTIYTFAACAKRQMLFAGTSNGIFHSSNNGETWEPKDKQNPWLKGKAVTALAISPNEKTLFAGTQNDGVYVSQDDGKIWSQASEGMSPKKINTLSVSPDGKKIFAGTNGGGLYSCRGKARVTAWRPWQKIALSIPVKSVACLYTDHRLHLFWLEETEKTVTSDKLYSKEKVITKTGTVKFSYHNVSGNWLPPQTLRSKEIVAENEPQFSFPEGALSRFNTGRNVDGSALALGQQDVNWKVLEAPSGKLNPPEPAVVMSLPGYFSNNESSTWLYSDSVKTQLKGTFKFEVKIDFGNTNFDGCDFQLRIGVDDNLLDVLLNGKSLGFTSKLTAFSKFSKFTVDAALIKKKGIVLNKGNNKLQINFYNISGPSAFRVEFGSIITYDKTHKINVSPSIDQDLLTAWDRSINNAYVDRLRQTLVQQGMQHLFSTERQTSFALDLPYSIYFREIFFHIPFLIANTLNRNQHFEDAQRWYHYIFNPVLTQQSNTTVDDTPFWRYLPFKQHKLETLVDIETTHPQEFKIYTDDPFDPHAIAGLRLGAYEKAIVMKYIDNLLDWGDQLFAKDSWESIVEAMLLYTQAQDLLGKKAKPPSLKAVTKTSKRYNELSKEGVLLEPFHVADTKEFPVAPNTQFASYWDLAEDRLFKIRHSMNIKGVVRQLALFQPPIDPTQLIKALASGGSFEGVVNQPIPHYRFSTMIQQAKSVTATLSQLGSAILSAIEKKDAEHLNLLRSTHEKSILDLTTKLKQKQIEDATVSLLSLNASLKSAQDRKENYKNLISHGLISQEKVSLAMTQDALIALDVANGIRGAAVAAHLIPTVFGFADGCFEPGSSVSEAAALSDAVGAICSQQAGLATIQGQNERRKSEWKLQQTLAEHDVDQINAQIKGGLIKQEVAQKDLETHLKSIQHANENESFLKTKFSTHDLYQWMVGRIASVYFQTYKMACDLAKQAESAYQYERDTNNTLITANYWDSLKKGLLAGEALTLGLSQLEKAYMDNHERELEIEKTISLRQINPEAWLALRKNGKCTFKFDEVLFDRDFPGHYCRKIKSIAITIPAIVGPYQNVQATLIQQLNRTVLTDDIDTINYLLPKDPKADKDSNDNNFTPTDLQLLTDPRQKQQIALSSGVKDTGVFELNFNDARYLPFEGTGAVSEWELRMPKAANRINFDSISDVIINLRYTAKEGGDHLRQQVVALSAIKRYQGVRLFNVQQEFSANWLKSQQEGTDLKIDIGAGFFPVNIKPEDFILNEILLLPKMTVVKKAVKAQTELSGDKAPTIWSLTLPKAEIDNEKEVYLLVNFSGDLIWDDYS